MLCHFIKPILCHGGFWPLFFSCYINIIIFDQRSTIVYNRVFNNFFFQTLISSLSKHWSLYTVWEAVVQNCCRRHPILCGCNSRLLYYHDRAIKLLLHWKFCRILIVVIFSTFGHYHSCSCRFFVWIIHASGDSSMSPRHKKKDNKIIFCYCIPVSIIFYYQAIRTAHWF